MTADKEKNAAPADSDFKKAAESILACLGGKANVAFLENCVTRLRLEVKDAAAVDEAGIRAAGAAGLIRTGGNEIQVIIGTKVQFIADEMEKLL